ncbi:hypothetical protein TNCV_123891 [Trichonephila clavipes]|nr:hypothetical protein TNCV_123891 [Trichonephila clavipes]
MLDRQFENRLKVGLKKCKANFAKFYVNGASLALGPLEALPPQCGGARYANGYTIASDVTENNWAPRKKLNCRCIYQMLSNFGQNKTRRLSRSLFVYSTEDGTLKYIKNKRSATAERPTSSLNIFVSSQTDVTKQAA